MRCKHCGNEIFYSTVKIVQYYNEYGEPCGSEETTGTESKYVKCTKCGYKTQFASLREENDGEETDFGKPIKESE